MTIVLLNPQTPFENVQEAAADSAMLGLGLGAHSAGFFLRTADQDGCARGVHVEISHDIQNLLCVIHSVVVECQDDPQFQYIFELLPDGSPLWRDSAAGCDGALAKLELLRKRSPYELRVLHLPSRTVLGSSPGTVKAPQK